METLINIRRVIFFAAIILGVSGTVFSQDYSKLQAAFQESYTLESAADLIKATEAMKSVYKEDSYEVNLRLGWLSYSVGSFTESIAYYQKAISLKPFALEPRFGLVMPASSVGNWEMVKQQYIRILEIDPMNTKACYYLGLIYYNREEYGNAMTCFEKMVNLFPFDYNGMIMYAWTNYKLGKLREAKVLFNKVLMISPEDASATEGLNLIQ